jgi:hypothetical protein
LPYDPLAFELLHLPPKAAEVHAPAKFTILEKNHPAARPVTGRAAGRKGDVVYFFPAFGAAWNSSAVIFLTVPADRRT